jgi:hypothetical protein
MNPYHVSSNNTDIDPKLLISISVNIGVYFSTIFLEMKGNTGSTQQVISISKKSVHLVVDELFRVLRKYLWLSHTSLLYNYKSSTSMNQEEHFPINRLWVPRLIQYDNVKYRAGKFGDT